MIIVFLIIPKLLWFDRMEGDQIITQHHQLQHLFEMNHLNGRFGEATEYNINLTQAEFCKELYEECPDGATLYGYFESYHYFKDAEEEVRSDFIFQEAHLRCKRLKTFIRLIMFVCLNVRRGKDFISRSRLSSPLH